jgi:hypothetical protein
VHVNVIQEATCVRISQARRASPQRRSFLVGATLVVARHHNTGWAQDPPLLELLFVGGDIHVYVAVREHVGRGTPASRYR